MDEIHPIFPPAARRVLSILAGFDPAGSVSGRAALWCWLPRVPRPIGQLDFVWHGLDSLDALRGRVVRTLTGAGLDVATLRGDSRRAWLGARKGGSACLLSLTAELAPALEPPQTIRLAGVEVAVDTLREVVAETLGSLHKRPDRQDLENAGLLLRHGISLHQGLADACSRNPDLVPLELALRLVRFEVEEPDLSETDRGRLRRHHERVVFNLLAWAADARIPGSSSRSPRAAH